jgi:hypothetical protein
MGGNIEKPGTFEEGMQMVREAMEKLGWKKPEAVPSQQSQCEWWTKLPKQADSRGRIFYWVPFKKGNLTPKDPLKEGKWVHESLRNTWMYGDQEYVVGKRMERIEQLKIQPYKDEIGRIDQFLRAAKASDTDEQIEDLRVREKTEQLRERIQLHLDSGMTENDTKIRLLRLEVEQIESSIPARSDEDSKNLHITDWPATLGGPILPNQDLYKIKADHKRSIRVIVENELGPLKIQQRRNQYHKMKWRLVFEKIYS